jgi:hypothetical protein
MTAEIPGDDVKDRDRDLARTLADQARRMRSEYREWIQAEIEELKMHVSALEKAEKKDKQPRIRDLAHRIDAIDQGELADAIGCLEGKVREIDDGGYIDILDARDLLNEGLSRCETLVRELLRIRRIVAERWADSGSG